MTTVGRSPADQGGEWREALATLASTLGELASDLELWDSKLNPDALRFIGVEDEYWQPLLHALHFGEPPIPALEACLRAALQDPWLRVDSLHNSELDIASLELTLGPQTNETNAVSAVGAWITEVKEVLTRLHDASIYEWCPVCGFARAQTLEQWRQDWRIGCEHFVAEWYADGNFDGLLIEQEGQNLFEWIRPLLEALRVFAIALNAQEQGATTPLFEGGSEPWWWEYISEVSPDDQVIGSCMNELVTKMFSDSPTAVIESASLESGGPYTWSWPVVFASDVVATWDAFTQKVEELEVELKKATALLASPEAIQAIAEQLEAETEAEKPHATEPPAKTYVDRPILDAQVVRLVEKYDPPTIETEIRYPGVSERSTANFSDYAFERCAISKEEFQQLLERLADLGYYAAPRNVYSQVMAERYQSVQLEVEGDSEKCIRVWDPRVWGPRDSDVVLSLNRVRDAVNEFASQLPWEKR